MDGKYKGLTTPELARTDEIREAARKKSGGFYSVRKRSEWINAIRPEDQILKGAPPKGKDE
jgi:hypothetical protein